MRLPGSVLQGILASAALVFLRVYLGAVLVARALSGVGEGFAFILPVTPVTWAELMVGVALLLGFLTRFSAAVVLVLSVNAVVVGGDRWWSPAGNDAALAAISLALLVGAAGRTAGLDAVLARRWPRSPFW